MYHTVKEALQEHFLTPQQKTASSSWLEEAATTKFLISHRSGGFSDLKPSMNQSEECIEHFFSIVDCVK